MKLSFCLSVLFHLVLLYLVFYFSYRSTDASVGMHKNHIIPIYFASTQSGLVSNKSAKQYHDFRKHLHRQEKNQHGHHRQNQRFHFTNASNKGHAKHFLIALHKAIARQQFYPSGAIQSHINGTVRLKFYLTSLGKVSKIILLRSSGCSTLDHAAMVAVQRISPFLPAKKYLQHTTSFSVNIIYKTTN